MGDYKPFTMIPRAVRDSPFWNIKKPQYLFWFVDLCFMAEYIDHFDYKQGIHKRRGIVYASIDRLANRWGSTWKTVKAFLDDGLNAGLLTYQAIGSSPRKGTEIMLFHLMRDNTTE